MNPHYFKHIQTYYIISTFCQLNILRELHLPTCESFEKARIKSINHNSRKTQLESESRSDLIWFWFDEFRQRLEQNANKFEIIQWFLRLLNLDKLNPATVPQCNLSPTWKNNSISNLRENAPNMEYYKNCSENAINPKQTAGSTQTPIDEYSITTQKMSVRQSFFKIQRWIFCTINWKFGIIIAIWFWIAILRLHQKKLTLKY